MPSRDLPLLTIAIPTFNRAKELAELLDILYIQTLDCPGVEVIVSDNGSIDETQTVIAEAERRFSQTSTSFKTRRNEINTGPDSNFLSCFTEASGQFFWICGDDDRPLPGALAEVMELLHSSGGRASLIDIIYATSYGFSANYLKERQDDPLGRRLHTFDDPKLFARVVNVMFTFVSGIIVNKGRLDLLSHDDPASLLDTNLVQLAWSLPLLLHFRSGIVLWNRPIAARLGHANGYSLAHVFGSNLPTLTRRLLQERSDLISPILNPTLRIWFPSILLEMRSRRNEILRLDEARNSLQRAFGKNPRFWIFVYPALTLPLNLARVYLRATSVVNKLLYMVQFPGFWRKQT